MKKNVPTIGWYSGFSLCRPGFPDPMSARAAHGKIFPEFLLTDTPYFSPVCSRILPTVISIPFICAAQCNEIKERRTQISILITNLAIRHTAGFILSKL